MSEIGKYIYGIINSKEIPTREEIYAISYQDVSAVVQDAEIMDTSYMLKDTLANLLVKHQTTLEKIMSLGYSVIPMKLATYAEGETEVKDILNKGYRLIKETIQKINDKIETDVVATWNDFDFVLREIGEDKEIKELKENLLTNNPGGVTMEGQMKVGIMVKKVLDVKREKYAYEIQNALKTVAHAFKVHELMDDKMVTNTAFLVERAKQIDFDSKIEELNIKFRDQLDFRCVGPLPPYSFYTLEVKKLQFEEIDRARKRLGLDNSATKEEIKKTYHRLAFASHPDRNPHIKEMEFTELNRAYKLLLDWCAACPKVRQGKSHSFKGEEVNQNTILVRVLSSK